MSKKVHKLLSFDDLARRETKIEEVVEKVKVAKIYLPPKVAEDGKYCPSIVQFYEKIQKILIHITRGICENDIKRYLSLKNIRCGKLLDARRLFFTVSQICSSLQHWILQKKKNVFFSLSHAEKTSGWMDVKY